MANEESWRFGHTQNQKECRTYGAPAACRGRRDYHPSMAQPGWADVWRAGPPGLGSRWLLFCGSLTQGLMRLWRCQRSKRFPQYCAVIKIARSGFPWEKTTKSPMASVYTNRETAVSG
jgi:hypothetical protein